MDLGLRGARVLVTAASGGLGAATALQFSREGAVVVINSRSLDKLQETAARINEETGNAVFTHAADVTAPNAAEKLINNAVTMMGGIDILITNAGGPPAGRFEDVDETNWRDALELTFISARNLIHHALPHLKQSQRASVLAITSISAKEPIDNLILSNAIRPAVIGMMKSLSREHGKDGIRFNSILPGITETERVDHLMNVRAESNDTTPEQERDKAATNIPLRRFGQPNEFANAAVFLSSPAASFITGVALLVDGGASHSTL